MSASLYHSPWVAGTRAVGCFGPVHVEHNTTRERLEQDLVSVLWRLSRKAEALGANAVIGLSVDIHLGERDRYRLVAVGTAARLEPIAEPARRVA